MLKVIIAEDEVIVREGMKKNIDWESESLTLVADASDGEQALTLIRELKPDILITDIKMPFMDGIELSRIVKKEMPEIKIIIVSGYNEFQYAKEAISIGVTEYLLKPIGSLELLEKVVYLGNIIKKERLKNKKENLSYINGKRIDFNEIDILKAHRSVLENFVRIGTKDEVKQFVTDYIKHYGKNNMKSNLCFSYIEIEIYICCTNLMEEMGEDNKIKLDEYIAHQDNTSVFTSIPKFAHSLEQLIIKVIDIREKCSMDKHSKLIKVATDYIKNEYSSKDCTLNLVADVVGMSSSYFSVIFSQETGQNFIEYLTQTRMNKAKELLRCTSKKVGEIGLEVGYKDTHYFNVLFKKIEGCTPKEYRLNGQNCTEKSVN